MKYNLSLLALLFFVSVNFAQNVTWEDDYIKALRTAEETNSVLMFYFKDGKQKSLERNIESSILKSNNFRTSIGKSIVVLTIDNSDNAKNITYNKRLISAYNPKQRFPALAAKASKLSKSTPLLTEFKDKDVSIFISELKTSKD